MSRHIKFKFKDEMYSGLIYSEEDLYYHVKVRLVNNMSSAESQVLQVFDFSKIDESHIDLKNKKNFTLYDLILFIDDHFNIKEIKNTYCFKKDQIKEILFSEI